MSAFDPASSDAPGVVASLVVSGIGELVTNDPNLGAGRLGVIEDAALVMQEGRVAWAGPASALPEAAGERRIDVGGRAVIPGFVDSHTHLVFAGDRVPEFVARMAGVPYGPGGILATVAATRAASDEQLEANLSRLVPEALASGTTTLECKSGYGLSVTDERRSCAIAAGRVEEVTFLGAHAVPPEYAGRTDDYVGLVCGEMLEACAPFAGSIDVFCERGAFDADQAAAVLAAGAAAGLVARVHANQLGPGPGVQVALAARAASADHCTHLRASDVDGLAGPAGAPGPVTVATLLPAAEFATRSAYAPARRLLDAGATIALATDCNPGTAFTTSMAFCIALAVREMAMTPAEALWSATAGGAAALRRQDVGRLGVGARADLVVLEAPRHEYLAYRPGVRLVHAVIRGGEVVAGPGCRCTWSRAEPSRP